MGQVTFKDFSKGFLRENPVFVLLLGMCPTLGVTTSAVNGLGMGLATTAVLLMSNILIALLKNLIPDKVRIPAFIVVIASFVTMVDLLMAAYLPMLHEQLGLFIPLIVVNCIILGRAESYASKNKVFGSFVDGLSMGLGFTFALTLLGGVREILGSGEIFGYPFLERGLVKLGDYISYLKTLDPKDFRSTLLLFLPDNFNPKDFPTMLLFILPPGAFIALGLIIAWVNTYLIPFINKLVLLILIIFRAFLMAIRELLLKNKKDVKGGA